MLNEMLNLLRQIVTTFGLMSNVLMVSTTQIGILSLSLFYHLRDRPTQVVLLPNGENVENGGLPF